MSVRTTYPGFRQTIKAVATGPRGSRNLSFDEAREAGLALLDGAVSPAQAGAFLIGLRFKGEGAEELAGIAQAVRDRALDLRVPAGRGPIVVTAGAFDGIADSPSLGLAATVCAAAAGAAVVIACATRLGPKHGVTPADVLAELGGPARPAPDETEAMLERSGAALLHAAEAVEGWEALAAVRDEVGLRGPFHSAEKLVDWFGAKRFVVGHTHGGYGPRLLGALERLGADRAIALRGIEGSDVLRPGRPIAASLDGPLDLPERLGMVVRGDSDPAIAAGLTRAVLSGDEHGPARHAVTLSAALRLLAAGLADTPTGALTRAEAVLDDGRAAATLDAFVG